jgi:hypothetical protein
MNASTSLQSAPAMPIGPATSAAKLADLACSGYAALRQRVASHPNCSEDVLVLLAHDDEFVVRLAVARNHRTPVVALAFLSMDDVEQVRRAVRSLPALEHVLAA